MNTLTGVQVAILVGDGFATMELTEPRKALELAGAQTYVVSPTRRNVRCWHGSKQPRRFKVDVALGEADADDYDILLVPGGVRNADRLGRSESVLKFVRAFFEAGKPVAKIIYSTPWWWITVWNKAAEAVTYRLATGNRR